MESTVRRNTDHWIDKIAYILLGIILFDCMALGGGSYIKIKGIDIRMIWFALFFLASLPAVFRNFKKLITNLYALCLLVWLGWLMFSTIRGYRLGNDRAMILSGLIGFASFGILPGCLAIVTNKERIIGLMKVAVVASVLLSVQTIALLLMHNLDGEFLIRINSSFLKIELGVLSIVDDNVVRIFLRSHPLAIFGCGCAVYLGLYTNSKCKAFLYSLATALVLFSLLTSFTRSLYLAVLAAVAFLLVTCFLVLDKPARKRLVKWLGTTAVLFLVVLQTFDMVCGAHFLSYGLYRSAGIDLAEKIQSKLPVSLYVDLTPGPTEPEEAKETKPAETKETEEKETKPKETKPKETKPKETKPKETKPKETKPKDTKPKETKPKETKPKETKPAIDVDQISDDLRAATQKELLTKIKKSPIIGSGMGAVLKVRAKTDKVNEYFYLDQVLKMGIVGIVLYMLPMLLLLLNLLFRKRHMDRQAQVICISWMTGLLAIAVFSYYNPYLNGSNGIVSYCGTIAVMSTLHGKQQLFSKK